MVKITPAVNSFNGMVLKKTLLSDRKLTLMSTVL